MRHIELGAEHVADAMARAHRHAGGERAGREPGSDLAIHPRRNVLRVGLHPRQTGGQHLEPLDRLRVAVRVRLARADALDAMVDGADAGRQEQPVRRVHREFRIEDGGAWHHQRMAQHLLLPLGLVGDACDRGEFAAGDRGRHADLPNCRRIHLGRDAATGADGVDAVGCGDIVGEAELHRFGTIRDRAAADGDDQVGLGIARLLGCRDDRGARRMRRHPVEDADAAGPERLADSFDLIGLAVQCARDHQEGALRAQPVQLLDDGFTGGPPEHDLVHGAKYDTASVHAPLLPQDGPPCRRRFAERLAEEIGVVIRAAAGGRNDRAAYSAVVPAKAGIHNHRVVVLK